jgi:hypothetical protein
MNAKKVRCIPLLSGLILILSISTLLVNYFIFKFPSNNYFPENVIPLTAILLLFYVGLILIFDKNSRISQSGLELFYLYLIMFLIALATNAVQLTPFPPIDDKIVYLESLLHIDIPTILAWTNNNPRLSYLLKILYDTLAYQMCFLPLTIIALGKFHILKDYFFLLLFTTLIGFCFYYFFPTTAPASIIKSPFFSSCQIATGIKFNQIHHHLNPTTMAGGLIALPSFHTIWALLCVYLLKEWKVLCSLLLIVNTLLIASCVLLGWHYLTDVISAVILVMIAYWFLLQCKS